MPGIGRGGVDSRTDGGTPHIDGSHFCSGGPDPSQTTLQRGGIGFELLTQPDGNSILQLGAAHLQHGIEFHAFPGKGLFQGLQAPVQVLEQEKGRQLAGGGDHIVGGLAPVHVIVGMDQGVLSFFTTQQFDGDVGDHFVGIHIERGTGTALDGV
jgi:hypothetical protein